jgi:hypothetical protein
MYLIDVSPKLAKEVKKELSMRVPAFDDKVKMTLDNPIFQPSLAPNQFMKEMDSSFENFFY